MLIDALFLLVILLLPVFGLPMNACKARTVSLPCERAQALLDRMTRAEKIAHLPCQAGELDLMVQVGNFGLAALACTLRPLVACAATARLNEIQHYFIEKTRLGITVSMADESLHHLLGKGVTSFPQATALAAIWDTHGREKDLQAITFRSQSRSIRQVFSPLMNIARDARGRCVEQNNEVTLYPSARMGRLYLGHLK